MVFRKNFNDFLNNKKIGIFIITKLGSKRFKDKAKKLINNKSLIEILVLRLMRKFGNKYLFICSSGKRSKKFLKYFFKKYKIRLFFGENKNVLGRIIHCAEKFKIKHIVRVTGDNPLTDCSAIKSLVLEHYSNKNDYTFTTSLPHGTRPEVFSLPALKKCLKFMVDKNSSEYLSYFFLREDIYKIQNYNFKKHINIQNYLNISIDYKKDYILLKKLLKFYKNNLFISRKKIILFLSKNSKIKKKISKVPIFCKHYDARYKFDRDKVLINNYNK